MLSKETSPNVLKLVIKGFGLFAGPCRTYMKPADVKFMFTIIVQQAEQMYLRRQVNVHCVQINPIEEDMDEMVIENLADYVEALSSIMAQLENVSSEQLSSLQYLSVLLLENFPKLTPSFRFFAVSAIAVTMCNVMSVGGTALDDFLTHFSECTFANSKLAAFVYLFYGSL
ncbi:hypothetical protein C0J52_27453 [Blattella germanica]|nr:hypothetical protein C0J52_27453 [Blattella germanica]